MDSTTYTDPNGDIWKVYRKTIAGGWRWSRKARNGEIVGASTEAYSNYGDCVANARRNGMIGVPR